MTTKNLNKETPDVRPGDIVRIHQRIKEGNKERIQIFEGLVLARKHGKGISSTITVRRVISGIGVEKIFPINSPTISKIEIIKRSKVRRAKLYFLRKAKGKKARLKQKDFSSKVYERQEETPEEEPGKETKEKPKEELGEETKEDPKEEEK